MMPNRKSRSNPNTASHHRDARVAGDLTSRSPKFRAAVAQLERFARHDQATVLLEGESGTGKSYFARHLYDCSLRAREPFHHVSLAAMDDNLASSDLFGHVQGAFTDARHQRHGHFATAHGGVLFLDEIGKSSKAIQPKLLHAVEAKEITPLGSERSVRIDTRIVAASNIPLQQLVDENLFLPDLYARLECFRVVIPPLRDRRADIPTLVTAMIAKHAHQCGYSEAFPSVAPDLMRILQESDWPNNVRQLDAVVQRILIDAEGAPVLTKDFCPRDLSFLKVDLHDKELTREIVTDAVSSKGGKSQAARALRVHRSTIYRHLDKSEKNS